MVLNVMVLLEFICLSVLKGFWVPGRLIVCGVDKVLFLFFVFFSPLIQNLLILLILMVPSPEG